MLLETLEDLRDRQGLVTVALRVVDLAVGDPAARRGC